MLTTASRTCSLGLSRHRARHGPKLECPCSEDCSIRQKGYRGGIGMLCRRCEALSFEGASRRRAPPSARVWGAERISGLHCVSCGTLLGAEDIAQLLLQKESQLAQFGLVNP